MCTRINYTSESIKQETHRYRVGSTGTHTHLESRSSCLQGSDSCPLTRSGAPPVLTAQDAICPQRPHQGWSQAAAGGRGGRHTGQDGLWRSVPSQVCAGRSRGATEGRGLCPRGRRGSTFLHKDEDGFTRWKKDEGTDAARDRRFLSTTD